MSTETQAAAPPPHGTYGAAQAHHKRGEAACESCRRAQREYMADWRRRTRGIAAFDWPLHLPVELSEVPALGAVLAAAWRAS